MTSLDIKVENLWKQYHIGGQSSRYRTFRESIQGGIGRLFKPEKQLMPETNFIWALREISFKINQGEVVGVIGKNGAGKSTLLKVLAHITQPTRGRVEIHGRVGSLLEVGTGFHPELTGRENVFLNGAILGMKKKEIERKFDEIVAFAEVEKFLDTPAKHYSTGMFMRLAFAVAAHLEPEILIIDEVLAVGDAEFQKKCLGKMGDVAHQGRTVLFVSHNLSAVKSLCTRCLYLEKGRLAYDGETTEVIQRYKGTQQDRLISEFTPDLNKIIRINRIEICSPSGYNDGCEIDTADGVLIKITYDVNKPITGAHAFLRINTDDNETLISTGDADVSPDMLGLRKPGRYNCRVLIPPRILGAGRYSLTWSAGIPFQDNFDVEFHALAFHIVDQKTKRAQFIHKERPGLLALDLDWKYEDN